VTYKSGVCGETLRIVVIGGGFTGAVFVIHAISATARPLDIVVIEPAAALGRGTAYGTSDAAHRINVPLDRMVITQEDPDAATRWFTENGFLPDLESDDGSGLYYIPRQAYGRFMTDALQRSLAAAGDRVRFQHLRGCATSISRATVGWRVSVGEQGDLESDLVVLCFGHATPAAPCPISADIASSAKFVANPWAENALQKIGLADCPLIVGTGLTMADVVLSLHSMGRTGPVTAISRRGLLPRGQGVFSADPDLFQGMPSPQTAMSLLRMLRQRIRTANEDSGWQPIIDALRSQLPDVWNGLPEREQRKVQRFLLAFWDVHRFRIAPQVNNALARLRTDGRLRVQKAGLKSLAYLDGQYEATLRLPGGRIEHRRFDAIILCTGPEKDVRKNPLVAALLAAGQAKLDSVGLGLAVDRASRVLDAAGRVNPGLLAFGPMTRGSFGEMTGAPDIANHIEQVSSALFTVATSV
jgi:uncharacterized NAD(P)/FAD-binding protein YdhS